MSEDTMETRVVKMAEQLLAQVRRSGIICRTSETCPISAAGTGERLRATVFDLESSSRASAWECGGVDTAFKSRGSEGLMGMPSASRFTPTETMGSATP